jgi:hypothetical protein
MRRFLGQNDEAPPSFVGRVVPHVLIGLSWLLLFLTLPFSLVFCLKIVHEYKRMVRLIHPLLITGTLPMAKGRYR